MDYAQSCGEDARDTGTDDAMTAAAVLMVWVQGDGALLGGLIESDRGSEEEEMQGRRAPQGLGGKN